jgi:hypothetical protein
MSPATLASVAVVVTSAGKHNSRMAVVLDPHGRAWSVHRDWWPFPGDLLDFTDLFEIVIGLVFVVLWPFWLVTKFLGAATKWGAS